MKRLIPFVLLVLIWFVASRTSNPIFLPKPEKVVETFVLLAANGELWRSLGASLFRVTAAVALSALVAVPIGLLTANYRFWDLMITPLAGVMGYVPPTALYPLFILLLGIDEPMKISFLFAATFVYFLPTTVMAIKEVPHGNIEAGEALGLSKVQIIRFVQLPIAMPDIAEAFIVMYGIGWTYVIVSETINAHHGLGHLMNIASARGRTDIVFVAIAVIVVFSYLFETIGDALIKQLYPWEFQHAEEEIP